MVDDLISLTAEIYGEKYARARVIFLAGSLIRGEGTSTSDLDLVVVFDRLEAAYRESYIYKNLFGYDLIFIAIDKVTHQIGIFDCSDKFLQSGEDKVKRAAEAYELFYKTEDFDPQQFLLTRTL